MHVNWHWGSIWIRGVSTSFLEGKVLEWKALRCQDGLIVHLNCMCDGMNYSFWHLRFKHHMADNPPTIFAWYTSIRRDSSFFTPTTVLVGVSYCSLAPNGVPFEKGTVIVLTGKLIVIGRKCECREDQTPNFDVRLQYLAFCAMTERPAINKVVTSKNV